MDQLLLLLEQCLENGDQGAEALAAWFEGQRDEIEHVITDTRWRLKLGFTPEAKAVIESIPLASARGALMRGFSSAYGRMRPPVYRGEPVTYCDLTTLERIARKEMLVAQLGDKGIAALAEALKAYQVSRG